MTKGLENMAYEIMSVKSAYYMALRKAPAEGEAKEEKPAPPKPEPKPKKAAPKKEKAANDKKEDKKAAAKGKKGAKGKEETKQEDAKEENHSENGDTKTNEADELKFDLYNYPEQTAKLHFHEAGAPTLLCDLARVYLNWDVNALKITSCQLPDPGPGFPDQLCYQFLWPGHSFGPVVTEENPLDD
ncbi:hypothetical protein DUI87_02115 [Hirundo rustica rustica]|uniref:Uncharacterized protein n=1 Tax=Hirundo rustica rustica TaxID=333673 RepID=A0A3M0L7D5_HIRRU|nr:hypothetical protein DUI87_02115 [Hirundo rustica rustica]